MWRARWADGQGHDDHRGVEHDHELGERKEEEGTEPAGVGAGLDRKGGFEHGHGSSEGRKTG